MEIRFKKLVSVALILRADEKSVSDVLGASRFMYLDVGGGFTDFIHTKNKKLYLCQEYRL